MADSAVMVNACYRRQHPEAFGPAELAIAAPELPGFGETVEWAPSGSVIPEAPMGDPGARQIAADGGD